jgi:hypothetical protein
MVTKNSVIEFSLDHNLDWKEEEEFWMSIVTKMKLPMKE